MRMSELERVVQAAREIGENEVLLRLEDGTLVEIHFTPPHEHPTYTSDSLERFFTHQIQTTHEEKGKN